MYIITDKYSYYLELKTGLMNITEKNKLIRDRGFILEVYERLQFNFSFVCDPFTFFRIVLIPLKGIVHNDDRAKYYITAHDTIILSEEYNYSDIKSINKFNIQITPMYISLVCRANNNKTLEYLQKKKFLLHISKNNHLNSFLLCDACRNGYVGLLELWKHSGLKFPSEFNENESLAFRYAFEYNNVNILQWLVNNNFSMGDFTITSENINQASYNGHINVLEWWKHSGLPLEYNQDIIFYLITKNDQVKALEWWKNSGLTLKNNRLLIFRSIEVVEWWKNSGLKLKYFYCPKNLFNRLDNDTKRWLNNTSKFRTLCIKAVRKSAKIYLNIKNKFIFR
jgi:hypothetical protein